MITARNIANHELIGLSAEVVGSRNASQIGAKGKVVDETMKTITIEDGAKERTVAKARSTFRFTIPSGARVRVAGDVISHRPEDRIKKTLEKW